ncbi:TPA: Glycoside hydrolase 2 (Mannanase, beta-galactosidase) [Trebouxia sp. C0005]|nr:MAG: Ribosome biogenesis BMS1 [Trebouxia sp. A1-2]
MAVSKAAPKKKIKKVKKAAKKKLTDKANRKADPSNTEDAAAAKARNPKAFVFSGRGKAKLQQARSAERDQKRMHVPVVDTTPEEPPPFVVVVHGPPGVGKTTLIKNLIKHYVNQNLSEVKGPITVVSGKTRRLTFVECPQDLHGMIDAAKYADLVLLMVDGGFGFEMETFEFLNLLQVHGFPKVMGVLTHLDGFKDQKKLKKTKKALKHRFWAEIYQGAKLFYLSGMKNGKYMKREVLNLARFISVMKFRPLNWRMAHPYLLTDRLEDITPVDDIRMNPKCDREIALYGYLRGTKLKGNARVHIAGVGDATVEEVDALTDPCPLPSTLKKRGLNERERLLYAPMADVGGLLYDKDAVYIDIPDWKLHPAGAVLLAGGIFSQTPQGHVTRPDTWA